MPTPSVGNRKAPSRPWASMRSTRASRSRYSGRPPASAGARRPRPTASPASFTHSETELARGSCVVRSFRAPVRERRARAAAISLRTWITRILMNKARTRGVHDERSVPFSSLATARDDDLGTTFAPDRFLPPTMPGGRATGSPRRRRGTSCPPSASRPAGRGRARGGRPRGAGRADGRPPGAPEPEPASGTEAAAPAVIPLPAQPGPSSGRGSTSSNQKNPWPARVTK
jgi:hypothetical protein